MEYYGANQGTYSSSIWFAVLGDGLWDVLLRDVGVVFKQLLLNFSRQEMLVDQQLNYCSALSDPCRDYSACMNSQDEQQLIRCMLA